ncbi:MAG: hypothetical protein ABGY08_05560 [Gammaproteobacteria bacterium]
MVIKEVELLFQAGALDVPAIKQHDQGAGWVVTLSGAHQLNPGLRLQEVRFVYLKGWMRLLVFCLMLGLVR